MDQGVYEVARERLEGIYGRLSELESGTGARCSRAVKGKITLYRKDIASGNKAEIAFDVSSMAARAGQTEASVKAFLRQLQSQASGKSQPNPRFNWPRVGLSTHAHVEMVVEALKTYFAE